MLFQKDMAEIIKSEMKRLEEYMKEELQAYFDSYEPTVYKRTGDTMRSITLNEPYVDGDKISAEITFDESLANHPSVMSGDQPMGYTPWLLESGWSITSRIQPRIAMFTDHAGTQYVSKAVERFNATSKYGIKVSVYHNGERYI